MYLVDKPTAQLAVEHPIAFALELYTVPVLVALVLYFAGRKSPREFLAEVPMFSRSCLTLVLALAAALAPQATPGPQAGAPPTIPETPAGRTFKAWLEAFNSGHRAVLDAYLHNYDPSNTLDDELQVTGM